MSPLSTASQNRMQDYILASFNRPASTLCFTYFLLSNSPIIDKRPSTRSLLLKRSSIVSKSSQAENAREHFQFARPKNPREREEEEFWDAIKWKVKLNYICNRKRVGGRSSGRFNQMHSLQGNGQIREIPSSNNSPTESLTFTVHGNLFSFIFLCCSTVAAAVRTSR